MSNALQEPSIDAEPPRPRQITPATAGRVGAQVVYMEQFSARGRSLQRWRERTGALQPDLDADYLPDGEVIHGNFDKLAEYFEKEQEDQEDADVTPEVLVSAYDNLVLTGNELQLDLMAYVLEDAPFPEADIHPQDLRRVRELIAGTIEVNDPGVVARFNRLNITAYRGSLSRKTLISILSPEHVEAKLEGLDKLAPFQHPDALCVPAADHDAAAFNRHVNEFFPGKGEQDDEPAKAKCRECLARTACLEFAIINTETDGVWGAMNSVQLRGVRNAYRSGGMEAAHETAHALYAEDLARLKLDTPDQPSDILLAD